ncbi:MAG: hypothetical protein GEV09_23785 [Pseudonocardiaceae bacterium]|nr:hypothetical protein [Pseudonocardiaceae bacterium]
MGTIELTAPPATTPLFARAALGALSGQHRPPELPDTELVLPGQAVDLDHLAAYARVCGFDLADRLPLTYPHVLGFGLQLALMTGGDFPFPLLGLVHIRNRITRHRPIRTDELLTVRVRANGLADHERGSQFVLTTEVTVAGDLVWSGESTYLRRSGSGGSGRTREATEPPAPSAVWRLPEDTGRRYAAVSGDRNPIHLHRLAARAFGFPRAIAHGMYTKARCLAALGARLPEECVVDVAFGKPVLLPGTVGFSVRPVDGSADLALHGQDGRCHLTGTARPAG